MRQIFWYAIIAISIFVGTGSVSAQTYPNRPVTFLIGFTPGAITDGGARIIANEMEKRLGQKILLEYKPGASGTIAAKYVVSANPDGYTLLFGATLPAHPLFSLNNAVDTGKELVAVSRAFTQPFILMSSAKLPVTSFQELITFAKAKPDGLTQGTSTGQQTLIMELLREKAGIVTRPIPYKGSSQVASGLLAGEVDLTIGSVLTYLPHYQAGTVRLLFVSAPRRISALPNIPTAAEVGLTEFDQIALDYGLWAPPGTPREIVQKISIEMATATKMPAVGEQIRKYGAEPVGSTPEEQLRVHESVIRFWSDATKKMSFKPQ